jgi:hypothetical protein
VREKVEQATRELEKIRGFQTGVVAGANPSTAADKGPSSSTME